MAHQAELRGRETWNETMLGYRLKNGRYEIVPEEAELVRRIYDFVNDAVLVFPFFT